MGSLTKKNNNKIWDILKFICYLSSKNTNINKQFWSILHSNTFLTTIHDVIIRLYPIILICKWNTIMDICKDYSYYGIEFIDLFPLQQQQQQHWYCTYCILMSLHYLYISNQLSCIDLKEIIIQTYNNTNIIKDYNACLMKNNNNKHIINAWIIILGDIVSGNIYNINKKLNKIKDDDNTKTIILEKEKKE